MSNEEVFFTWSPAYSVGIQAIDDQHRELVSILNRLFVAVAKREGDQAIGGILNALLTYTGTHFALEERLMKQAGYQDYEAHRAEHRKLLAELDQLCKKHMIEEKAIYFETLSFLKAWLREHIQGVDTKYSAVLRRAGFSTEAWQKEATAEFARMSDAKRWWEVWKAA